MKAATKRKLPPPRVIPEVCPHYEPAEESISNRLARWRTEHEELETAADAAGEAVEAASAASMLLYEEAMAAFEKFNRSTEKHDDARAAFRAAVEAVDRHWKAHPL